MLDPMGPSEKLPVHARVFMGATKKGASIAAGPMKVFDEDA